MVKSNTRRKGDDDNLGLRSKRSNSRNSSFSDIVSTSRSNWNVLRHSTPEIGSELQVSFMIFDLREMDVVKGNIEAKAIKIEKNQRMMRSNSLEKKLRQIFRLNQQECVVVCSEREFSLLGQCTEYRGLCSLAWEMSVDGIISRNMMGEHFFTILLNAQMYKDASYESRLRLLLIKENKGNKYMMACSSEISIGQVQDKLIGLCSDGQLSEFDLVYKNQKPDKDKALGNYIKQSLSIMSLVKSHFVKVSLKYRITEDISTCLEMKCPHTCTFEELQKLFNKEFSCEASKINSCFSDGENLKISLIAGSRDIIAKRTMLFNEVGHLFSNNLGAFCPVGFDGDILVDESDMDGNVDLGHIEMARHRFSYDVDINSAEALSVIVERVKMGMKLKPVCLLMNKEQKLAELKTKLHIYTNIPEDAQKLSYGKILLENDNLTASELNIFKPGKHTLLILEEYQPFSITGKFQNNEYGDMQIQAFAGTKVETIKLKIAEYTQCHIWQVCLLHSETKISLTNMNDKSLSQCSIAQDATMIINIYKQSIRVAIKSSNEIIHNNVLFITNPNERHVRDIKLDIADKCRVKDWSVNVIHDGKSLDDNKPLSSYNIFDGSKIWVTINSDGQVKTRIFECEPGNGPIHASAGIVIGGHILKGPDSLTPEFLQLLLDKQTPRAQNYTTPIYSTQSVNVPEAQQQNTQYMNSSQKDVQIQTSQSDINTTTPQQRQQLQLNMNMSNSISSSIEDSAFLSSELDSASPSLERGFCTSQQTSTNVTTPEPRKRCDFVENACGSSHSSMCSNTSVSQKEVITDDCNGIITSTCQQIVTSTKGTAATSETITMAGQANGCDRNNTPTVIASNTTMTSLVSEGNQLTVKHSQHSTWNVHSTDMNQLSLAHNNLQLDLQSNEPLQKGLKSLGVMDSSRSTTDFFEPIVMTVSPPTNFVTDKLLHHVAKELGRGGLELGRILGLNESEIDAARNDNHQNTLEFNNQILRKWKEKLGYNATKDKLVEALEQSGKMNIVHKYLSDSASENECQK